MTLGTEVYLSPGDFVLDGDHLLSSKKGQSLLPKFSAHVYCGQTVHGATWYGGRPRLRRRCVRWRSSSPPHKGGRAPSPTFGPCLLCYMGTSTSSSKKGNSYPNFRHVCCGQTALCSRIPLGMEVGLGPCDFVFDGDTAPPQNKRAQPPPSFLPMFIVAKPLDGSRCHLVWRYTSAQVTLC